MKELHDLKDMLCEELKEYGKKGELTAGSLDVVDKLTHTMKNLDKIIEKYDEEGYSQMYPYTYEGTNRGGSYARRGRRSYENRSMARYARHDMAEELRGLMEDAPDERTRMEIQKLITKIEQM